MKTLEKKKIPWNDYPPIEKCTDMGDTNMNHMDISIDDIEERIITLDKAVIP